MVEQVRVRDTGNRGGTFLHLCRQNFFKKSSEPCLKYSFLCQGCSEYEMRVIVINPRAYVYINLRTVMGENAPIVIMKYISLS